MKMNDHLVIQFAALWSCTLHAYDDPHCWQKLRQGQMLKRWCTQCKNVWIYGYNYNLTVSGLTPLPEFTKLQHDFPLMKKWGVIGFYDETQRLGRGGHRQPIPPRPVGVERRCRRGRYSG